MSDNAKPAALNATLGTILTAHRPMGDDVESFASSNGGKERLSFQDLKRRYQTLQERLMQKGWTKKSRPLGGFLELNLAMTYSHMGKPHTTIGDEPFHC